MPQGCPTSFYQPVDSSLPIPADPHIPGLPRDLIALAQLRHRPLSLFILKDKPQLLFHHTARFPWHALFLNLCLPPHSVRYPPGPFCQECARSVPSTLPSPYPLCSPNLTQRHPRLSDIGGGSCTIFILHDLGFNPCKTA